MEARAELRTPARGAGTELRTPDRGADGAADAGGILPLDLPNGPAARWAEFFSWAKFSLPRTSRPASLIG